MIDYGQILNNNSDNENLYNICDDFSENLPFCQNNERNSIYPENNLKTDFNSKSQISNQNNNPCLNEIENTFIHQTENNFDKEENEAINKDKVYFINEKRKDEDKKIEKKKIKKNNFNKNNLKEDNKNENDKQKILGRKRKILIKKGNIIKHLKIIS